MDYVEGLGKKGKKQIRAKVAISDTGGYLVGISDGRYKDELLGRLNSPVVVGGTYTAPDGSLLKAYYALEAFFDGEWEATVVGEIEQIPYEDGVIY